MGHLDVSGVGYALADGRPLLDDVSFRVPGGSVTALIGPNGVGKSTLLGIVTGRIPPDDGVVTIGGSLAVMSQFVGVSAQPRAAGDGRAEDPAQDRSVRPAADRESTIAGDGTVRDLLLSVSPEPIRAAGAAVDAAELTMMTDESDAAGIVYATALADWADVGGYQQEIAFDRATVAALGVPYDRAKFRSVTGLSGGEQKRLVLELLLSGPQEVLLLDEPDNFLDVPAKVWLEGRLAESDKAILLVSHDRQLLADAADRIVTLEPGGAGARSWVHGASFTTYARARADRNSRLEELRRRWDEEHEKLKALVLMYRTKAAYNDGLASRYQAALTRLAKFEEAGPPEAVPRAQTVSMRLRGGRTAKRAVVCHDLALTGLLEPFDLEIFYGERVAVLGSNGSGKSHLLRLLAAGGSDPDVEHRPVGEDIPAPVAHTGRAVLGARVRPGYFRQLHSRPDLAQRTLLEILHRGDEHRDGMGREQAARVLDRYGLARASEQTFRTLSGGQQARMQILLLELSGATLLLLDEPTDNLDLDSAEALEEALDAFDGTVIAVTHDRAFARTFDRFLLLGEDGRVVESDEPAWDLARVRRAR